MKTLFNKILGLTLAGLFGIVFSCLSSEIYQDISRPFTQVIISDGIDLELSSGDKQQIEVNYFNVKEEDIVVEVKGKRLKIYLKDCQRGCQHDRYSGADVRVKLTYQNLDKLVVMGDNEVNHLGDISGKKFTLKVYGDNRVTLEEIHSKKFKTSLYGDNELLIEGGEVDRLKIKTFGDHQIKLSDLACASGKVHAFGDSFLELHVHDQLNLTMLGDASIRCQGNPWVDKKIVLGDLSLNLSN